MRDKIVDWVYASKVKVRPQALTYAKKNYSLILSRHFSDAACMEFLKEIDVLCDIEMEFNETEEKCK